MLVWQIVFGIVATWIFLANLPSPNEPPLVENLPRILQRFVTVIWIPIVVIFRNSLCVFGKDLDHP